VQAHEIVVGQTHGFAGLETGDLGLAPIHERTEILLAPTSHQAKRS
jgi:hypothetical protein